MAYELWDIESGNLVGRYATQDEALRAVRETVALYGLEAASSLLLGVEDQKRRSKVIARGLSLIERASVTTVPGELFLTVRGSVKLVGEKPPMASATKAAGTYARRDSAGRFIRQDSAKQVHGRAPKSSKGTVGKVSKRSPDRPSRKGK